jgi:hypothetical protein
MVALAGLKVEAKVGKGMMGSKPGWRRVPFEKIEK